MEHMWLNRGYPGRPGAEIAQDRKDHARCLTILAYGAAGTGWVRPRDELAPAQTRSTLSGSAGGHALAGEVPDGGTVAIDGDGGNVR
jgi:hypothetical protein